MELMTAPHAKRLGPILLVSAFIFATGLYLSQAYDLARGIRDLETRLFWFLGFLIGFGVLWYVGTQTRLPTKSTGRPLRSPIPLYSSFYRAARLAIVLWVLLLIPTIFFFSSQEATTRGKFVVRVAGVEGSDALSRTLSAELLTGLRQYHGRFSDTIIQSLDTVITETDGRERARKEGQRYRADVVIWGHIETIRSQPRFTIHVENLSLPINSSSTPLTLAQLDSFRFQSQSLDLSIGFLAACCAIKSATMPQHWLFWTPP